MTMCYRDVGKGQVTIPKPIGDRLGIEPGNAIALTF